MTNLIYLTSTPFTGSTLTSILMGSHPNIATISELTGVIASIDASKYRCSCTSLLIDCEFFREVARQVDACGLEFSYQNFRTTYQQGNKIKRRLMYRSLRSSRLETIRDSLRNYWPGCRQFIEECDRYNQTMIRSILEITGKSTFLDASKDPCRIPFLARSHEGPMHVLHITRDVRGYSNSFRKNTGREVAIAAKDWVRSHRNIIRISRNEKVTYGCFRYEDICRDTDRTIHKLYAHCMLSNDVDVTFTPRKLHLIGNRMRLRSDLTIRLDESWRSELTREEQAIAWDIGKDLMQSFGYSE